jgi:hypothetical protein
MSHESGASESFENLGIPLLQWIGLRENLHEYPIFNGKIDGFL